MVVHAQGGAAAPGVFAAGQPLKEWFSRAQSELPEPFPQLQVSVTSSRENQAKARHRGVSGHTVSFERQAFETVARSS